MTIWSPRPSSLTRSLTMGLRVAKDSAPESRSRPPTSWAPTAPPRWCRCSSRVTRMPAAARRRAEMRPEGPPPITMAVGTFSLRVNARAVWGPVEEGAVKELACAVRCGAWLVWPMVVLLWSVSGYALWGWLYQRARWLFWEVVPRGADMWLAPRVRCLSVPFSRGCTPRGR